MLCPLTSRIKGYPFEVLVAEDEPSVVLADQVKSIDWRARNAKKKGEVAEEVLAEVVGKLGALILQVWERAKSHFNLEGNLLKRIGKKKE